MKKVLVLVLVICTLFSSCFYGGEEDAERIKEVYENMSAVTAKAVVRATDRDKECEFELLYEKSAEKEQLTVLSPKEISGIVIPMRDGRTVTEESGVSVESILTDSVCTPADAIPQVINTLKSEIFSEICSEKLNGDDRLCVTYETDVCGEAVTQRIYLDRETCLPVAADVYLSSRLVITVDFTEFNAEKD